MKKIEDKILWVFLGISIIIIICNDFVFNETVEIFSFGDEMGIVLSNLSIAYISSLIFYYIVVVRKEYKDKSSIYKTVTNYCDQLISRSFDIYDVMVVASNTDRTIHDRYSVDKNEFSIMCANSNTREVYPNRFLGSPSNLIQGNYAIFIYHNSIENANSLINKIFVYMPFLDTAYIEKINKLKTSTYWIIAPALLENNTNTNFSAYFEPMWEQIILLRELNEINTRLKNKYNIIK